MTHILQELSFYLSYPFVRYALIVGVLILGSLLPEFELVRVAWPLVDGPEPVIPGTIRVLASNAEILLLCQEESGVPARPAFQAL